MRKTPVLYAVNIGKLIKHRWNTHGKIKVTNSLAEEALTKNKIKVYQLDELGLSPTKPLVFNDSSKPETVKLDKNHPDYKEVPCYIYKDNDLLLEGIEQARILTNSEEITQLPPSITDLENELDLPDSIHEEAKKKIMLSCVFDAYQEKLPKRKDPARPAFNFPRDLGITDSRKNFMLLNNLIQICEQYCSIKNRMIYNNAFFSYPMRAYDKLIQFELTGDVVVRSKQELSIPIPENIERKPVGDLYPVHCTITLNPYNFYTVQTIYPFAETTWPCLHTILFSCNKVDVKNLYEEEVLEHQIIGRNLLKGFCAAGANALVLYGDDVKDLPAPVTVQLVMTDGMNFHFSVFQLNSLNVEDESAKKNIYWNPPIVPLYENCKYLDGVPVLTGYNPEVLNRIMAFYKNN